MPKFQFPDAVRALLARRYRNQCRSWLAGEGRWPLEVPLGCPREEQAKELPAAIADWVDAWRMWEGPGAVVWSERHWRTLGVQRLPDRLVVDTAEQAAYIAGEEKRWALASRHYRQLTSRWPALRLRLIRWYDTLADLNACDIGVLETMLAWLERNPRSGLFPRQLPIPGMDTKWIEQKLPLAADLLLTLRGEDACGRTAHQCCGLNEAPNTIRLRILDPCLRRHLGGLGDVTAPLNDVRALCLPVDRVYIVENLQTGLAFEERRGAIVIMGLGYGVTALADIPCIANAECTYWGDVDTHGFAILNRARSYLPHLRSLMMDERTLLRYRDLWVREPEQCQAADLPLLTDSERSVYRGLKEQRWGSNIRLEQERIAWDEVLLELDGSAGTRGSVSSSV